MAVAMNMKQAVMTAAVLALAAGLAVIGLQACHSNNGHADTTDAASASATKVKTEKIVIGGETFELEVAADEPTRLKGLMHRDHIPDHGGMLFIFPDDDVRLQSFWMGHCLVDMDIIYLDPRGRVTATHRMKAQPPQGADESDIAYEARIPRYSSRYPAQFAIELKAGSLDRLNVKFEDRIEMDLPRLKALAR